MKTPCSTNPTTEKSSRNTIQIPFDVTSQFDKQRIKTLLAYAIKQYNPDIDDMTWSDLFTLPRKYLEKYGIITYKRVHDECQPKLTVPFDEDLYTIPELP